MFLRSIHNSWLRWFLLLGLICGVVLLFPASEQAIAQEGGDEQVKEPDVEPPPPSEDDLAALAVPQPVSVALISDQSELSILSSLVQNLGFNPTVLNNNWTGSQAIYTSDLSLLNQYDIVIWYASGLDPGGFGFGVGRLTTQAEQNALESYLQGGGRLLVTGYDTLGHPSDLTLAAIVRSATVGDAPFTFGDYEITNGNHPIATGPFGPFNAGLFLTPGQADHDNAQADTSQGAMTIAKFPSGPDKVIAAPVGSEGLVVYWNGNQNLADWLVTTPISNDQREVLSPLTESSGDTANVEDKPGSDQAPLGATQVTPQQSLQDQTDLLRNILFWLAPDPNEANNTPTTCTDITYGSPISGVRIEPQGDFDYYCLNGIAGQTIIADIDARVSQFDPLAGTSSLDSVLALYDTDGTTLLAANDDEAYPQNLDSKLQYTFPSNGIYYLRVRSFAHPCCGGPNYYYSILVNSVGVVQTVPFFDDFEPTPTNGWSADGLWHLVEEGVDPYPNNTSPTRSFWYGQNSTGDYDTGTANSGNLTSPLIELPNNVSGATLLFQSWYETEPSPTSTIYFDTLHNDSSLFSVFTGDYTGLRQALVNVGNTIVEGSNPLDTVALNDYDTVVLIVPSIPLSQAEINALDNFVNNGGRLVLVGDRENFQGSTDVLNAFAPTYGITFNDDIVRDFTNNAAGDEFWPRIYNFAPNETLTLGLETLQFYAGASLSLSGTAVPLASGDNDTDVFPIVTNQAEFSAMSASSNADDKTASSFDLPDNIGPLDVIPGAPVVAAYNTVGNGAVVAIGDSDLWVNSDVEGDGLAAYQEFDNLLIAHHFFDSPPDNPDWDQKFVQISVDGGPFVDLAQITGGPQRVWQQEVIDLTPYLDTQIQLRFRFETSDPILNDYRGWYIDDVAIDTQNVTLTIADPVGPSNSVIVDDDTTNDSNGDNDGVPEPGEDIELIVELRNNGSTTAEDVVAVINSTSPYLTGPLYNTDAAYPDIPVAGTAQNLHPEDWEFEIAPNTPNGHVANFTLTISGSNFPTQVIPFTLVIGSPGVPGPVVASNALIDDDFSGNSNGNGDSDINPGETVELYLGLSNLAANANPAPAVNVNMCLEVDPTYVTGFIFNDCSGYGSIAPYSTAFNFNDFEFTVDPNTPATYQIPFTATITAANGGPWTDTFTLPVFATPVSDTARIDVEPTDQDVGQFGTFTVDVAANDIDPIVYSSGLGAFQFDLAFDPSLVTPTEVNIGPFLGSTGRPLDPPLVSINNNSVQVGLTTSGQTPPGPVGYGDLATVVFRALGTAGQSNMTLTNTLLVDVDTDTITHTVTNGQVNILNSLFADLNNDGIVNIQDLQFISTNKGIVDGDPDYNPTYDVNSDGKINFKDWQQVACFFGWPDPNIDFTVCVSGLSVASQMTTTVKISPTVTNLSNPGDTAQVEVAIENADSLGAFGFEFDFDPNIIRVTNVDLGPFIESTGRTATIFEETIDSTNGKVTYQVTTQGPTPAPPSGNGILATLEIELINEGDTTLDLNEVEVTDIGGNVKPSAVVDGEVTVAGSSVYLPLITK